MASTILHIKDSYYFQVPKALWRSERESIDDFPDFWVRLDADFGLWQAEQLYSSLDGMPDTAVPAWKDLKHDYQDWLHHDHHNAGKSLAQYVAETEWFQSKTEDAAWVEENSPWLAEWNTAVTESKNAKSVEAYQTARPDTWSPEKIEGYNKALDGKILVPQPFGGQLRNMYEADSGFCVSRFMIIEMAVAIIMAALFIWLGGKIRGGERPRGRLWNMLEAVLLYMRDEVARPAIGKKEADKYVPLLWTMFLFVLGCNLFGMIPWVGAPTGSFGMTLGMASVTFATGIICGSMKFGVVGFWLNQVPSMDLPLVLAVVLKPVIFLIEVMGLFIKHAVLGVRLLANMVAGHLVLLAIMGLAFSVEGALNPSWGIVAPIAIFGSTLFSCLELFVAFLQAYVFTFLSALFIGAAIHHH